MAASPHLLLLHVILLLSSCLSASQGVVPVESGSHRRVELSVYYEALCPYCGNFILNQLVELFKTDIVGVVNLRLVPWGNASLRDKSAFTCQHGPDECRLNTIEACVVQTWPDFRRHYGLVHCIERQVFAQKENQLQSCFRSKNEWQALQGCYNSGLGTQDYGNFLAYICRAYTGPEPNGCRSIQQKIN